MKRKVETLALVLLADIVIAFFCLTAFQVCVGTQIKNSGGEMPAGTGEGKFVALTFDDGPHSEYTKKLLDGLRKRDVKASFFLIGESIPGNEDLVRQMWEDGHLIGTHCYSHVDLTKETADKACEDILKTNRLITDITGKEPEYIRPPYGIWSDELDDCVGMTRVLWTIDTQDWKNQNTAKIVRHIEKNVGKHQVILMHDTFKTSVDAALAAIDTLKKQGYTFVTVDELLID